MDDDIDDGFDSVADRGDELERGSHLAHAPEHLQSRDTISAQTPSWIATSRQIIEPVHPQQYLLPSSKHRKPPRKLFQELSLNVDRCKILRSEVSSSLFSNNLRLPERRVFSDPLPRRFATLADEFRQICSQAKTTAQGSELWPSPSPSQDSDDSTKHENPQPHDIDDFSAVSSMLNLI